EKKSGRKKAMEKIALLMSEIDVAESNKQSVMMTIKNKAITDFEDGLEYYSAINAGCRCIVTHNPEDFYFSEIEVLETQQFLEKYVVK
ncbi:MAG TPA: hypothetical protein VI583_14580, partial [Cyclobacteriaceae bacterium]|nr:hypothetical protein [Cyclobacteriaceae bacterium]